MMATQMITEEIPPPRNWPSSIERLRPHVIGRRFDVGSRLIGNYGYLGCCLAGGVAEV